MKKLTPLLLMLIVMSCQTNMAVIKQDGKYGLINTKGDVVVEPSWDDILGESDGTYLVVMDELWGYLGKNGDVIIEPQYLDADFFDQGLACVGNQDGKYGFINKKGETIVGFIHDESFGGFSKGLADVTVNDSCGYIDRQGKVVIPFIYESCNPFLSDLAVAYTFDGEQVLLNKKGESTKYDEEKHRDKDLWSLNVYPGAFKTENGRGRVNAKGDTIIPPSFLSTGNLSDKMHIVQDKNEKWGAYNSKGDFVITPQFDNMWHFNEGVANYTLSEKWGYVNKKGEIVIDHQYDYASQFNGGLAYVELNGKAGFIDKKGQIVIPIIYEPNRSSRFK